MACRTTTGRRNRLPVDSAAVNLAGIHHDRVTRGHEVATPGYLVPSRLLTARIQVLPDSPWPLKHRSRVRLHVGTAEVLATVSLPTADRITPGRDADVQLFLRESVVTSWNQPFVLRSESPVVTIAGGRVLVPAAAKLRRPTEVTFRYLRQLQSADSLERAAAAVYFAESACQGPEDLARTAGVDQPAERFAELLQQEAIVELAHSGQRKSYVHCQRLEEYADRILAYLERLHERNPLQTVFDRASLMQQFAYLGGAPVAEAVLRRLQRDGLIRVTPRGIGLSGRGPKLSKGEQQLSRRLLEDYQAAACQPPTVQECQRDAARHQKSVPALLALAASEGELVEIAQGLYLHADVEQELRGKLQAALADGSGMTLSEIRELLQTTRKYAVPICEYLDRIGFTERDGDLRRLCHST